MIALNSAKKSILHSVVSYRITAVLDSGNPHNINQRCLRCALEVVNNIAADLLQEVVEWRTEDKHLQNLYRIQGRISVCLDKRCEQ